MISDKRWNITWTANSYQETCHTITIKWLPGSRCPNIPTCTSVMDHAW